ncbi:MAG: polysaccharide deacetylase family protein [Kiritimatiellae bacterium]|nr:polysaccharide deacetylase family protein [Kiritimatiellia bacterium]
MPSLRQFKHKLASGLAWLPVSLSRRLNCRRPMIAVYHVVSDHPHPHYRHILECKSAEDFAKDMDFLLRHYAPLDLKQLIDAVRNGRPMSNRTFHVTFDDGLRDTWINAGPILRQKGIPATFFLNTAFIDNRAMGYRHKTSLLIERLAREPAGELRGQIECILGGAGIPGRTEEERIFRVRYRQAGLLDNIARVLQVDFAEYLAGQQPYMTGGDIEDLIKQGFTIGAHSIDHPYYADLTPDEQLRQTRESVEYLVGRFALPYRAFAFPYADIGVSPVLFDIARKTGMLDISFGTCGVREDACRMNLQRTMMDGYGLSARQRIVNAYLGYSLRALVGRGRINRNDTHAR